MTAHRASIRLRKSVPLYMVAIPRTGLRSGGCGAALTTPPAGVTVRHGETIPFATGVQYSRPKKSSRAPPLITRRHHQIPTIHDAVTRELPQHFDSDLSVSRHDVPLSFLRPRLFQLPEFRS